MQVAIKGENESRLHNQKQHVASVKQKRWELRIWKKKYKVQKH
jgi:hypothetical protein